MITSNNIYSILSELENTSSKNEKESILDNYKADEVLKECFRLGYSPTINFYMKKLPEPQERVFSVTTLGSALVTVLEQIASRKITGNRAKDFYASLLGELTYEDQVVLNRVVNGDMKCGVGKTIVNKIWKGLVVVPPRMGAASMNEKSLKKLHSIKNLTIELKSDGSYAASVCGENSTMMSRNGNPLEIEMLSAHLSCGAFDGFALEGELVYDLTKATREAGNGIITKIVKGTASHEEKDGAIYQVWDCIHQDYYSPKGKYPLSNQDRRSDLERMVEMYNTYCKVNGLDVKVQVIERKENVSVDEAMEIFESYVKDGFEGAIAKDMDAPWSDTAKPAHCIKLKRKETADLKVVGKYEGKKGSKAEGMLGGLHCESECGRIKVNVGSGFSEEERIAFWEGDAPPIIESEYDSITKDKKTKQESLFLPIYKRPRYDKLTADTYQDILDKVRIK